METSASGQSQGEPAVALMQQLLPLMGARRKVQIEAALACYVGDGRKVLSQEQAMEIRMRAKNGESMKLLADEYVVSYCTIKKIKYGETWKYMPT